MSTDGYGHGALLTARHLLHCGCRAFAVATLEEGVALRRALLDDDNVARRHVRILVLGAPVGYPACFDTYLHYEIEVMVSGLEVAASLGRWMRDHDGRRRAEVFRVAERRKEELMGEGGMLLGYSCAGGVVRNRVVRVERQRGGQCEAEEEGAEIACGDEEDGDASNEQRVAYREEALECSSGAIQSQSQRTMNNIQSTISESNKRDVPSASPRLLQTTMNAATLTNVTGHDLAREVRQILIGQKHAVSVATKSTNIVTRPNPNELTQNAVSARVNGTTAVVEGGNRNSMAETGSSESTNGTAPNQNGSMSTSPQTMAFNTISNGLNSLPNTNGGGAGAGEKTLFCGIEDAAKASRQRELRRKRLSQLGTATPGQSRSSSIAEPDVPIIRKKLRWHALVDSGMGRLGFTTREGGVAFSRSVSPAGSDPKSDCSQYGAASDDVSDVSSLSTCVKRDTVDIIKELYDAEVHDGAPIEFYGMCTHMAEAHDKSTYTHDQMDRFRSLIYRVRSAGIAIPTISTDNSAALLTPSLTHFDPDAILSHDTRGFVRTGGAIYGQRPAFKQLRAVSTLVATVSNVAIIHEGESVGYDRAYVATENVRIATLTIGFADGYPRELGNGVGRVSIRGATFPVAGNVCMDMLMVELGPEDDMGVGSFVTVGDTAVLWGPEEVRNGEVVGDGLVPLAELAAKLKTTQSALTCGLDKIRVQRQVVE
ncbi:hypothetical protein HJC23_005342 [Cyclotella cryptica]|uniref:Alanine racemase C-terminal domain-containing protein n=1 Tax=Cyclotella cryptica TaxID=29204 RepID=A0ABD3PDV5_9STRA